MTRFSAKYILDLTATQTTWNDQKHRSSTKYDVHPQSRGALMEDIQKKHLTSIISGSTQDEHQSRVMPALISQDVHSSETGDKYEDTFLLQHCDLSKPRQPSLHRFSANKHCQAWHTGLSRSLLFVCFYFCFSLNKLKKEKLFQNLQLLKSSTVIIKNTWD